jgi:hypothetical protein
MEQSDPSKRLSVGSRGASRHELAMLGKQRSRGFPRCDGFPLLSKASEAERNGQGTIYQLRNIEEVKYLASGLSLV